MTALPQKNPAGNRQAADRRGRKKRVSPAESLGITPLSPSEDNEFAATKGDSAMFFENVWSLVLTGLQNAFSISIAEFFTSLFSGFLPNG